MERIIQGKTPNQWNFGKSEAILRLVEDVFVELPSTVKSLYVEPDKGFIVMESEPGIYAGYDKAVRDLSSIFGFSEHKAMGYVTDTMEDEDLDEGYLVCH